MRLIQKNDLAWPSGLIPRFDGAILSLEWQEALWDTSRERHDHARRQSSDTAVASVARAAESRIDPRTVSKWRKRATVEDENRPGGPAVRADRDRRRDGLRSGAARACHWTTAFMPCRHRSRISRGRRCCLRRHGVSRLPDEGDRRSSGMPSGAFTSGSPRRRQPRASLTKFAVARRLATADRKTARSRLCPVGSLTDNGSPVAERPRHWNTIHSLRHDPRGRRHRAPADQAEIHGRTARSGE